MLWKWCNVFNLYWAKKREKKYLISLPSELAIRWIAESVFVHSWHISEIEWAFEHAHVNCSWVSCSVCIFVVVVVSIFFDYGTRRVIGKWTTSELHIWTWSAVYRTTTRTTTAPTIRTTKSNSRAIINNWEFSSNSNSHSHSYSSNK